MSERTIVVKGTGHVSVKPDLTTITMSLTSAKPDYKKTMETAGKDIEAIRQALMSVGHEREALKTTDFRVRTEYDTVKDAMGRDVRDANGNIQRVFKGYVCNHSLKLEFDFDMKRLGETLMAISTCKSKPTLNIDFSVKDKEAVSIALLENAVANATEKATVMTKAAGVKLGAVRQIHYAWGELRLMSDMRYDAECSSVACCDAAIDIEPDDIKESDTVTVIWAIE